MPRHSEILSLENDDGDFTLIEVLQMVHILATVVWPGAILVSGLFVVPRMAKLVDTSLMERYSNRLSKASTYAVVAILISGVSPQPMD